jgi:membrane protein required for colicin V production
MNWVDLVVLAVIALSGLLAFMRGIVREVLGVGAWVLAAFAASPWGFFPYVQPWVAQQFADPTVVNVVAFGGVFLLVLIVLWLIAGTISNLVRESALGGLDRTLGLVFGLARGAVLLMAAYIGAGRAVAVDQWPPAVLDARSLPAIYRGAAWIAEQIPPPYRPEVAPPPEGRRTSATSLLRANPAGRALGARPARE